MDSDTEEPEELWCFQHQEKLLDIFTDLKEYIYNCGLPLMQRANFADFVEFCEAHTLFASEMEQEPEQEQETTDSDESDSEN